VQPAAGEALRGDGDGVLGPVGDPGRRSARGECGQPVRREDLVGLADAQDAAPGAGVRVDLVALEIDDLVAGGGGELAPGGGAEDDLFVVEEVDNGVRRAARPR
jgi:hypothetical protein